jgi:NAD(P)-dependent dehydrogenase (short-subunit alcohol dehydrogenase family)
MKSKIAGGGLHGKIAVVTGASRGIGLAIAQALAREGCHLVISSRDSSSLHKAAGQIPRSKIPILSVVCDVRNPHDVEQLMAAVKRHFRHLDILINNAGVAHPNLNVAKLPVDLWREVIETNLTGTFLVTRSALTLMRRGGAIVNNLSIAAKRVFPGSSAYNASKHGALGFTDTLREELRGQGIRVIALLPGATDTAIWKTLWPEAPRKKMMSPKTVAEAVVNALLVPDDSTVEELTILPSVGTL